MQAPHYEMNMIEPSLKGANVVIAAKQLNPTIFDQIWLVDNEVATRDDFRGGMPCVTTQAFAQFVLPSFTLCVVPEQMQFAPNDLNQANGKLVAEKLGRIVRLLPQTPYVAAGLNFIWQFTPDADRFAEVCRSLFFQRNPLFSEFDSPDARFGGYLSTNKLGARLRLDVRPIRLGATEQETEALQFTFNYNCDLPRSAEAVQPIIALLDRWDAALEHSALIVGKVAEAYLKEGQ